jgi:hypothetical protein
VSENSLARRAYFSESDFSKMLAPPHLFIGAAFLVCTKCLRSKSLITPVFLIFGALCSQ